MAISKSVSAQLQGEVGIKILVSLVYNLKGARGQIGTLVKHIRATAVNTDRATYSRRHVKGSMNVHGRQNWRQEG